ncbi:MAG: adenylate/guanylate cyclase domain-containing protein, partial [Chloroflexi bacterium]|nr:adenylate/guanylate cyclase domain-containing protein [Chloroflexota bacterium]
MSEEKSKFDQMWHDWFMTDAFGVEKRQHHLLKLLPHDPRCKFCHAPFEGAGALIVRTLYGKKQSALNPRFCNVCDGFAETHPGGAEVEMAMLFADVRGSTELSEQMSPTEFSRLINRFYIEATRAVIHEDGLVEKLAGDAVAAFWGAGFAGPDYVARTLQTAQNILKTMNREKIPVGIGVHFGVAYFGAMGEVNGLVNISAIGDEVNLAARLASKAAQGEI